MESMDVVVCLVCTVCGMDWVVIDRVGSGTERQLAPAERSGRGSTL